jgi:hypothetical protein
MEARGVWAMRYRLGVGVCLTGKSVGPDWCESGSLGILQCEWGQRQALTVEGDCHRDAEHEALVGISSQWGNRERSVQCGPTELRGEVIPTPVREYG